MGEASNFFRMSCERTVEEIPGSQPLHLSLDSRASRDNC